MAEQRAPSAPYRLGGRRAGLIWGIGVSAYVVAVFHRYSLGFAGVEAAQRFGVSAAGPAPLWLLVLLILAMAPNTPGSMIGFDYARSFNPAERIGRASGILNVGGFSASLVAIVLVGLVLDARTPAGADAATTAFRWAFAVQFPIWLLGAIQVWRWRRRARARLAERDPASFAALRAGVVRSH